MSNKHMTLLALALATAWPARAQSTAELLTELQALRERVAEVDKLRDRLAELERRLGAASPAAPGAGWGMTPDQLRELNRLTVKAEALEDARDAAGFKQLKISGYADPAFVYNQRQDRAGFQFLNPVADGGYHYDNSYFGAAVIDFQKEMEGGSRWRLTLAPNRGIGAVLGANSPVYEASVSLPLTDMQTRLTAGQIPDWSGYEYAQPTLYKFVTHNLLFDFTIPTAYTGVGIDVTQGSWIVKGVLGNVNASAKPSGDKSPALAYRVDYAKGEFQGFGLAGTHGRLANLADPEARATRFDLFELDAYFIRGDWTVQGQWSIGRHRDAAIVPDPVTGALRDARWTGVSLLAAYKPMPRWELAARADHLRNHANGGGLFGYTGYWDPANGQLGDTRNGFGVDGRADCVAEAASAVCNTGANRSALSLGASYQFDANTVLRAEARFDWADAAVFVDLRDGSYHRDNRLLGASVVVSF